MSTAFLRKELTVLPLCEAVKSTVFGRPESECAGIGAVLERGRNHVRAKEAGIGNGPEETGISTAF